MGALPLAAEGADDTTAERAGTRDALVQRARAGEDAAKRRIYEEQAPTIFRRIWRLIGDRARAEELCQETFLVAFGRLDRFRGDAKLSTWLHGIAFNLARDELDRRRRRIGLRQRFRVLLLSSTPEGADAKVAHDDLVGRLRTAMDALTDDQREAYVLRVVEALPLEECARLLAVPVSTISHRARRAEQIVREQFEREEST